MRALAFPALLLAALERYARTAGAAVMIAHPALRCVLAAPRVTAAVAGHGLYDGPGGIGPGDRHMAGCFGIVLGW
jgi:hypothetical protein